MLIRIRILFHSQHTPALTFYYENKHEMECVFNG